MRMMGVYHGNRKQIAFSWDAWLPLRSGQTAFDFNAKNFNPFLLKIVDAQRRHRCCMQYFCPFRRGGGPIYYQESHELCIIAGGPQTQLILSYNSTFI